MLPLMTFLDKIIAFIWTYAIMRPGVNALRTPVYPEMINVVNNKRVTFDDYKFDEDSVRLALESYQFTMVDQSLNQYLPGGCIQMISKIFYY